VSKYVLYGGKGGVGKTTCAAATALARARGGSPTLVVSTDPAHSLSDVFDASIGSEPTRIRDGLDLWAVEVDPAERVETFRGGIEAALDELEDLGISLDDDDLDDVVDAGIAPGTDEAAAMDLFVDYMDDPRYDTIVFDTAPTGHTLRLLELPDVMESAMGKLVTVRSQVSALADSVRGLFGTDDGDDGDDGPEIDLERLQERMARAGETLRDPDRTEFRVVLVPETMAILESERLLSELSSYGVPVGGAVVNKVLEDPSPGCERCQSRHRDQQDRIAEAETRLGLSLTVVPEQRGEVHGFEAIEAVAAEFSPTS